METVLRGRMKSVTIAEGSPFVIIGERINPSGYKRLREGLDRGDLSLVRQQAMVQAQVRAFVIDVNVATGEVVEEEILPRAIQAVAEAVDLPISVDTANPKALAAALTVCPGKPLINSVTGEDRSLKAALPLAKERGAAVIGLCMDEEGIPRDAQHRLEIAKKIIAVAEACGIPREDVLIDPLAMSVGADPRAGVVTLEAIRLIRMNLGVNTTLGGSNVSFGLPQRSVIERSFLAMAIAAGLTCALVDPLDVEIRKTIAACDLLTGRDEYAVQFLARWRGGW